MADSEPGAPDGDEPVPVHGLFVQAPIAPLDEDGIVVLSVGTVVFAVAAVLLGLQYEWLDARGDGWWLAVAVSGVFLGLIGLAYCWRRRGQIRPDGRTPSDGTPA
jgi:Protein of unknown function (DUF2530)